MKKIVLIGFLSGLCLNVFSQGIDVFEDLEESYESLKSTEEKLDFIFDKILNKQISDYICKNIGGNGAFRELSDLILSSKKL